MFTITTATPDDVATLTMAWHEAAFWRPQDRGSRPSLEEALKIPDVARYLWDPSAAEEVAVVAVVDGVGVGGAWTKNFSADAPGYGYVEDGVPELGIGVATDHQGRGAGRALLSALIVAAGLAGYERLSLSVEWDNPSRNLYAQLGFRDVAINDNAFTMMRSTTSRRDT